VHREVIASSGTERIEKDDVRFLTLKEKSLERVLDPPIFP